MRTRLTIFGTPHRERDVVLCQRQVEHLIQQLVAQATIEAFDKAVLHRLARRDEVPVHGDGIGPSQNGVAGKFRAVVSHSHLPPTALGDQSIEFAGNTPRD